jgi:flagellar FliL protein
MKLAIIGLVAVVLLGGAAAGAYFYFDKPAVASLPPTDKVAVEEHEAKLEGSEAAAPKEFFVELDALILPIMDDKGVTQTVSMIVSLEVPDEMIAKEVERMSPRLKDAFIQDMYGTLNRKTALDKGVVNVAMIKDRLSRISKRVMGEGKVNDVLLQVVQQRKVY